jgi:hypothetical protein
MEHMKTKVLQPLWFLISTLYRSGGQHYTLAPWTAGKDPITRCTGDWVETTVDLQGGEGEENLLLAPPG